MEQILELMEAKKYSELKEMLAAMEPADIAYLFDEMPERSMPLLYRLLPKELAAEVFTYMEPDMQRKIVEAITDRELSGKLFQS